jgi:outer membrane protein
MPKVVLSRGFVKRAGAIALAAAILAPCAAVAADDGRKKGYPGLPADSAQATGTQSPSSQPPGAPPRTQAPDLRQQRREQESQGEIRPGNPSETQRRTEQTQPRTAPTSQQPLPPSEQITAPSTAPSQAAPQQPGDEVPPLIGPTTSNADLTATTPLIQFKDVPTTRIGVDPSNVANLTLNDAIRMALERNLEIESRKYDTRVAEYNYRASLGIYDFNVAGELSYESNTIPIASVFGGGGGDASVTRKSLVFDGSFSQIAKNGGVLTGFFNNARESTDSTASQLNPQFNPALGVAFTQPLLRNFRIDANRRQIRLAKRQLDLTDAQFRQRVIEIINQVQRSYWDLVFAIRNEQIQRESVDLGRVQLENNLKQVEAGTLAPIELRSTEADLERRKGLVISALQSITVAENVLKSLLLADAGDAMWSARIVPIELIQFAPIQPDLESSIRSSIVNRPELEQLKIQTQLKEIDLEFYKDQTKPQVDFIARYAIQGLAGSPILSIQDPGGVLDDFSTALVRSLNQTRRAAGLDPFDPTPFITGDSGNEATVPDRFIGSYGRALGTLFSNDFRTWSVGVRIDFPLQNRTAQANYGRSQAELRQLDVQQRQLIQSIQVEVRNALQAVDAARQRYEAAQSARVAAEAQLRGEEERFRAGLSTNFFVLDRQNQLSAARGDEIQALTDYNKAIADLQRVTGTTMVSNNVQITE